MPVCIWLPQLQVVVETASNVEFGYVPFARNVWYPAPYNVTDGVRFRGYRYVDMDCSYCGPIDSFMSEANTCVLAVAIDPQGPTHFLAHISAVGDQYQAPMQVNLMNFMQQVNQDPTRPVCYIFRGTDPGNDQTDNLMALLSSVATDVALQQIAARTYFVEGENGQSWRAYSSVYVRHSINPFRIRVTFAR